MSSLPANIISLEDEEEKVNLLVYGNSGVGKTVWCGTAKNVLFLAPEDDGTISAKRLGSKAKKWTIKEWEDFDEAVNWLEDNPDHGFDVIVVDSITEMQQIMLRYILRTEQGKNASRDIDIPQIQDHQKWQNMFKRYVHRVNDLPVNVVWTALVRNETDEEGEEFLTPDIQGKGYQMSQAICSYMTSYGYMQAKQVKVRNPKEGEPETKIIRVITWQDTGVVRGKDRTNVLTPMTRNKNLQQVLNMIFPELTTDEEGSVTKAKPSRGARRVQSERTDVAEPVVVDAEVLAIEADDPWKDKSEHVADLADQHL